MDNEPRYPTPNEYRFLAWLRKREKRPALWAMLMLIAIAGAVNIAAALKFASFAKNLKSLIAIGAVDLVMLYLLIALARFPGYRIARRPLQRVEGEFGIVEHKKGNVRYAEYFVGNNPVIIPAHWMDQLKPGEKIAVEYYPLADGRHVVLTVDDRLSVDRDMEQQKMVL